MAEMDWWDEKEEALQQESMTRGEHTRAAVAEYASNHGAMDTKRAWILSPFDTWGANPHYVGPPVEHPED